MTTRKAVMVLAAVAPFFASAQTTMSGGLPALKTELSDAVGAEAGARAAGDLVLAGKIATLEAELGRGTRRVIDADGTTVGELIGLTGSSGVATVLRDDLIWSIGLSVDGPVFDFETDFYYASTDCTGDAYTLPSRAYSPQVAVAPYGWGMPGDPVYHSVGMSEMVVVRSRFSWQDYRRVCHFMAGGSWLHLVRVEPSGTVVPLFTLPLMIR